MVEQQSLWLGPLRAHVRLISAGLIGLTGLIAVYLIGGKLFGWSDVGMHELLRPDGRVIVKALLWSMTAAFIITAIYLSDTRGSIECEPTGPADIVSLVCSRLAMIAVATVVLVMFYEVVARYVFESPTLWANELSLWIASFIFLLAGFVLLEIIVPVVRAQAQDDIALEFVPDADTGDGAEIT